ncbi:integral membrane protein [Hypomontagnella submonticulosa]|nr:integral membrane protein [Hypomontagnella submonticulosa]
MSHRDDLIAAMVIFLVVDTIAMAARLYVRLKVLPRGAFGWDDIFLVMTYLGFVVSCAMGFTSIRYGLAATDGKPYYNNIMATRFLFANQVGLYISAGIVKMAVATILYRLAVTKRMRFLLIGSMIVVVLWTVIMTLFASWPCAQDGSSNWAGSKACTQIGYVRTSTNIVIDYFYALLPIFMLRKLQMSAKTKIWLLLILGLGAFSATIAKLVIIIKLATAKGGDAIPLHYDLLLWADIELGMAIFATAAVAARPLIKEITLVCRKKTQPPIDRDPGDAIGSYYMVNVTNEMLPMAEQESKSNSPSAIEEQIPPV